MSYTRAILERDQPPVRAYLQIVDAMYAHRFSACEGQPESFEDRLSVLSQGERALVLTSQFRYLVHNGGLHDYFGDTNCKYAQETACALENMGLHKAAEILRRALVVCQVPYPIPQDYMYDHAEKTPVSLGELDREFYSSKATWGYEEAVVNYVRQHPEEFV